MLVTVNGQQFNTDSLKGYDEQKFVAAFQGKLKGDLKNTWKQVKKHIEPPTEKKKTFRKSKKAAIK